MTQNREAVFIEYKIIVLYYQHTLCPTTIQAYIHVHIHGILIEACVQIQHTVHVVPLSHNVSSVLKQQATEMTH